MIGRFPVAPAGVNAAVAIDEPNHRLFIGCRKNPSLVVMDSDTGKIVASVPIPGDVDDLSFDARRRPNLRLVRRRGNRGDPPDRRRPLRVARDDSHRRRVPGRRSSTQTPDNSTWRCHVGRTVRIRKTRRSGSIGPRPERAILTKLAGEDGVPTKWVTRENAKVDRIACPWLIRRFIDRDAEFLYVPADAVMAVAEREGAIPYDVPGVEFGHVDGRCSFESILLKYGLAGDPALRALARIVHAADVAADIERPRRLGADGYRPRIRRAPRPGRPEEDRARDAHL